MHRSRRRVRSWPLLRDQARLVPLMHFAFPDFGAGVVGTTPYRGSAVMTFTRASVAWTRLATGLWAQVASGSPRSYYDASGNYAGYIAEFAATASATNVRDMTNAAWVKSASMTAAKDQVGIDGVANSASSLTSSGADQTALQTLVLGAANYVFQPFVKRITGTGEVDVTIDNGTTWTDITALISTTAWTQVSATKNAANPVCGFRVRTSGDKIAVDMCDLVNSAFAGTPVNATNRAADTLTFPEPNTALRSAGTCYAEISSQWATGPNTCAVVWMEDASGRLLYTASGVASTHMRIFDGTNDNQLTGLASYQNAVTRVASSWGGSTTLVVATGVTVHSASFDGTIGGAATTNIGIGCNPNGGGNQFAGTIKNVRLFPSQFGTADLQTLVTANGAHLFA